MADLTCLNEASVLHNVKERYYSGLIYVSATSKYERVFPSIGPLPPMQFPFPFLSLALGGWVGGCRCSLLFVPVFVPASASSSSAGERCPHSLSFPSHSSAPLHLGGRGRGVGGRGHSHRPGQALPRPVKEEVSGALYMHRD